MFGCLLSRACWRYDYDIRRTNVYFVPLFKINCNNNQLFLNVYYYLLIRETLIKEIDIICMVCQ